MDVRKPRERPFSILNDNDCPSFTIKRKEGPSSVAHVRPSISPIQRRPSLQRQSQYSDRNSSISSLNSPPLLQFDSSSSKSSSSTSMDSTPSPLTPAYSYNDGTLSYDNLLRQDLGFLPSPTTITPFMEQQMMLNATMADPFQQYPAKSMPTLAPAQYPMVPIQPQPVEAQNIPPPSLTSDTSASTFNSNSAAHTKPSPSNDTSHLTPKKNKYPCPYASLHNCLATFTTSGHAARHGKKHTGEKGVHCPVCNKAFTRKDNMKQHERTHKGSASGSNSEESEVRRSKAAITKDAQRPKPKKTEIQTTDLARRSSTIHSPLSEVTSLAPSVIDTPMTLGTEPMLYQTSDAVVPQMLLPVEAMAPSSLYPPLGDETMLNGNALAAASLPLQQLGKQDQDGLPIIAPMPPSLIRGFSDLDTLAQAAESFDPYYGQM